jgi:hypothetical protein
MKADQVETLKTNLANDVKQTYFGELVEQAKRGELDPDLYKPIHGAVYEMLEKDLVKDYNVEKGTLKEMIAKISKNGQSNDNEQLQQKFTELQGINENLVKEKEEAVLAARTEYEDKVLLRDKNDQLNAVPFDFSDVEDDKLEAAKASRKQILSDVFDARFTLAFSEDKTVVKDKDGKIRKNTATLEPLPASDVMKELAIELGQKLKSPETGGQGGQSSGTTDCTDNKIHPNSKEGLEIWAARRPQ